MDNILNGLKLPAWISGGASRAIAAPVIIVMMLSMMILPLPSFALDIFFSFNIALSVIVLLTSLYTIRPLDFMAFPAVAALVFGAWLWLGYGFGQGPGNAWLHVKLTLVLLLIGYHFACGSLLKKFEAGKNTRSHVWFRWFNEVPVVLLLVIVMLVVLKPF